MKISRISLYVLALCAFSAPAFTQDGVYGTPGSSTYNETRLSAVEDQMRTLNGRLEQIEYSMRRLEQTLQRIQTDTDARLQRLESAPPPAAVQQPVQLTPQPTVSQPVAQPPVPMQSSAEVEAAAVNGTLGDLKMQHGKVTGGTVNPKQPALPAVGADYGLTPQEQYDRAYNLVRQANYADAEAAFKAFIDKNPKDKLIDNAKYWYGETLYVRGQFDTAAVAFADAYSQNPQGNKAPDSLLKLALSLSAMKKPQDACVTLAELKNKYPNAPANIKSYAQDQRTKLKCPAR